MNNYLEVLEKIIEFGKVVPSRGNVMQKMLPEGAHLVFDMEFGFPLTTTKLVRFKSVWAELEWMLSGDSSIKEIMVNRYGVKFWEKWQLNEDGEMGALYGVQWRDWNTRAKEASLHHGAYQHNMMVSRSKDKPEEASYYMAKANLFDAFRASCEKRSVDQIRLAQAMLKFDKFSRRVMVTAWNPEFIDEMALPPCHFAHQYIFDGERLNLHMFIRSWDMFIGAPFNIAFYAAMLHLMSHHCAITPGLLVIHASHVHIYDMHWELVKQQIQRVPYPLPQFKVKCEPKDLWDYRLEDVEVVDYNHHEEMKGDVLV